MAGFGSIVDEAARNTAKLEVPDELLNIRAPDIEGEDIFDEHAPIDLDEDGQPVTVGELEVAADQISRDAFWEVFQLGFNLPGQMLPQFRPLGIQTDEKPNARAASDSVYRLLEIYYPAALLPQSEVMLHLLTAGPFLVGKIMIARAVMAAPRERTGAPASQTSEAANMSTPPAGHDDLSGLPVAS